MAVNSISAITFATHDMTRAVQFYAALGFEVVYGGAKAPFTSLKSGGCFVNLTAQPAEREWHWWGRVIFHVDDVDQTYRTALAAGYTADTEPRDAQWNERYFHITDPDGHELSFARPL